MGTLLGLGAVLAYHDRRCRVSGKEKDFTLRDPSVLPGKPGLPQSPQLTQVEMKSATSISQ